MSGIAVSIAYDWSLPSMKTRVNIIHARYNDGDPLSVDDQSYVLDSVFNYHPDKAAKLGSGIDYVTIDQHKIYQETICFYIVSSDGREEDFSYLKCLENFVKDKYPEMAVSFIGKYFNRKSARSQGCDGQGVTPASQQLFLST